MAEQFTPLIFSDQSTFLEVSGLKKDEILQTVESEIVNTKVKPGGLEGIYLTLNKQIVGLQSFITLTKSKFAPSTNKLLVSDSFLMGLVKPADSNSTDNGFFMLLKVRSSADIFDAMKAWENSMVTDLHVFLGLNISSETNYLFTKNFEDGVVENKNARILYDNNGDIVLLYVFADDNSVVITNSISALHEVMLRLAASRAKQ